MVLKPPSKILIPKEAFTIFLAGSIEMGKAVDWQSQLTLELDDPNTIILNPRRDDWDSSWDQSIDNPYFNEQVTWELNGMMDATVIPMYFDPDTQSPITLLELGLFTSSHRLVVYCPNGFWRKGNVDIICKRYGVCQVESVDELIQTVKGVRERYREWRTLPQVDNEAVEILHKNL